MGLDFMAESLPQRTSIHKNKLNLLQAAQTFLRTDGEASATVTSRSASSVVVLCSTGYLTKLIVTGRGAVVV